MRTPKAKTYKGKKSDLFTKVESQANLIQSLQHRLSIAENNNISNNQQLFSLLAVDHIPHPILWAYPNGAIFYINNATCRQLGYSLDHLLHMYIFDLLQHYSKGIWGDRFTKLKKDKQSAFNADLVLKSGQIKPVTIHLNHIELFEKDYCLCFLQETSEIEKIDLIKAQISQQDAINQITCRMIHNLNNQLTGIQGYAELLKMKLSDSQEGASKAIQIMSICKKAQLNSENISLAHLSNPSDEPFCLHTLLGNAISMFNIIHQSQAKILIDFSATSSKYIGHYSEINRSLLYIIQTLYSAIGYDGLLKVKTKNKAISKEDSDFDTSDAIAIHFSYQNGVSINPPILNRPSSNVHANAFLDAAKMVSNTVRYNLQLQGVRADFSPTTQELILTAPLPPTAKIKHKKHILFVDDIETITQSAKLILQSLDYTVDVCNSGIEAVTLYKQNPKKFDAVILDMILPDITGLQIFQEMKSINPKVVALLSSGYSKESETQKAMELGIKGFLPKPFFRKTLQKKLNEILSNR